jgi:hypothetical protein
MFVWFLIIYFQLVKPYGIKSATWRRFTAPLRCSVQRLCDTPWAAKWEKEHFFIIFQKKTIQK